MHRYGRDVRLAEIRVHPIKSCRPVRLDRANVEPRGLQHDRRYMVVDAAGIFVTLRSLPELAFIDVAITADHYRVSLPDGGEFALPHTPTDGPMVLAHVWRDTVAAREHLAAGRALTDWLGVPLRVVGMDAASVRAVPGGDGPVSFADAYPMLALSEASVADLSARVGAEMVTDRFRPNLVVGDTAPYEEDSFGELTIGAVRFQGATLCSRCVATTIDPASGARGDEPLRTLAGYRRVDGQVMFGVNLIPAGVGVIQVGDPVVVTHRVERAPA